MRPNFLNYFNKFFHWNFTYQRRLCYQGRTDSRWIRRREIMNIVKQVCLIVVNIIVIVDVIVIWLLENGIFGITEQGNVCKVIQTQYQIVNPLRTLSLQTEHRCFWLYKYKTYFSTWNPYLCPQKNFNHQALGICFWCKHYLFIQKWKFNFVGFCSNN